jgi:transcriptional regulator with XRE-family HTH domain
LKRKKITSAEICNKLGYNKTTVSRYFTDDMAMPATFIVKVAFYAKLNIEDLIIGDHDDVEDFIIDTDWTEALTSIASEPVEEYQRLPPAAPMLPEPPAPQRPIVVIDTSHLDRALSDLQSQIDDIRSKIENINK